MDKIQIFIEDKSELAEYESANKGCRQDVYVKKGSYIFNINVYDNVRLIQDFESDLNSCGYYLVEPNLVIVEEVNDDKIIVTLNGLNKQKYFDHLKPVENVDLSKMVQIQ